MNGSTNILPDTGEDNGNNENILQAAENEENKRTKPYGITAIVLMTVASIIAFVFASLSGDLLVENQTVLFDFSQIVIIQLYLFGFGFMGAGFAAKKSANFWFSWISLAIFFIGIGALVVRTL